MPKLFKTIYYAILGLLALIVLLLIFSTFQIPGNIKFYVVQSGSMEPKIKTGSVVLTKPAQEYKIGDIITFGPVPKGKVPTTHRIVEMRVQAGEPVYITKGDANADSDQREVLAKDILGKVYFDVPYVGYAVAWAKKPVGFLLLVVIPATIIIYEQVRKIIAEVKRIRAKRAENANKQT